MRADVVLMWLALFSAATLMAFNRDSLWTAKAVVMLALSVAGELLWPAEAGWIVGAVWAVAVVVPALAGRLAERCVAAQRYGLAASAHAVVWATHPGRDRAAQIATLLALRAARRGELAWAASRLERVAQDARVSQPVALGARFHQLRLQGRLDRLIDETDWSREDPATATLLRLRALASLGRISGLIAEEAQSGWRLRGMRGRAVLPWAYGQLWLLAGAGRVASVRRLLAGPLRSLPRDTRAYAVAFARLSAGDGEADALRALQRLAGGRDRDLAVAAARILTAPPTPVAADVDASGVVAAAEADLVAWLDDRAQRPRLVGSPVTLALTALNLTVFGVELALGGAEDTPTLMRMGALWPPYVLMLGQWWRVGAASFLHLGWVHLTMNMLALVVLGVPAERALGAWRMLATYIAAGVGAMVGIVALTRFGWMGDEMVVGASGAIMGLVGALLAQAARAWWRTRTRAARLRLAWVAAVVALQSALDVATPEVSFAGHALGGSVGLVVALLLLWGRPVGPAAVASVPHHSGEATGVGAGVARPDRRRLAVAVLGGAVALAVALDFPRRRERADEQHP